MFDENLFASVLNSHLRQAPNGANAALVAGAHGQYIKCDTRQELAAWFAGVSMHCRHILNGTKPVGL